MTMTKSLFLRNQIEVDVMHSLKFKHIPSTYKSNMTVVVRFMTALSYSFYDR